MADENYDDLYNSEVVDRDGKKIGGVGQVYLDDKTGLPTWVTVKTGLFGTKENFVPLDRAELTAGQIKVPYHEQFVRNAPNVEPDRHLDADEEAELYAYYGIATVTAEEAAGQTEETTAPVPEVDLSESPASEPVANRGLAPEAVEEARPKPPARGYTEPAIPSTSPEAPPATRGTAASSPEPPAVHDDKAGLYDAVPPAADESEPRAD